MSSSWSATPAYPPPPRRSRSRSPARVYPPREEPGYPQPSGDYRAEWDAYNRGRWDDYQRYEYGRRGRSRSPVDETGRKRRRSVSPYERDRYDPRPRYGDDYDAHSRSHGYRSPGRGQHPSHHGNRRAPPDPHTFDYQASLKQYADWFRYYYPSQATEEDNADKAAEQEAGDGSKPRNGIKSKWEKYKKEFSASQLRIMFEHHKKSPWFIEKYDPAPEYVNLRARTRREGWKGREIAFLHDLEAGKFDPDVNEPAAEIEPTSPVKENSVNDEGEVKAEGNGDAPPAVEEAKPAAGDDDMQFNVEAEEDAGENQTNDNQASRVEANGRGGVTNDRFPRGEEISVPPEGNQVMIRTIPPDIGRAKLEDACCKLPGYMYLALGDPLQKRNFYRAGWLRFSDEADMAQVMAELSEKKIEGFKLHVVHNLRPFVNRIRYTPDVASKPDRLEKDLATAKVLAGLLEDEAATLRKNKAQYMPAKEPAAEPADGEDGQSEQKDDVTMADSQAPADDDDDPKERGSEAVERRIEKVMSELQDQGVIDVNDDVVFQAKKTVVSLDLYLAYLRAAFHACFYCAVVTDHLEELQRKCLKHERKPLSKLLLDEIKAAQAEKAEKEKEKEVKDEAEDADVSEPKEKDIPPKEKVSENRDWKRNDERWLEWLDTKLALLIDRDGVDPRNYGGQHYDDELTKAVEPFVKQEDEGKFRCKTCQKLFKATSFVEKHIANKHGELVKGLDELPFFNNFALDPHRIQPFAHPPPAVGNSQGPPPQAYGIKGPAANHLPNNDYGRPAQFYGGNYGPNYPPPYANGGQWDHYGYQYAGAYPQPPGRRDESLNASRLSDRITGYAPGYEAPLDTSMSAAAGLPAKPMVPMVALEAGSAGRRANGRSSGNGGGPPPPPPPDAKEDPRAAAGKKVSYHDMDLVAEGDVELTY
ncbi:hypothetical protein FIBSPDRAFT_919510 [Athelia psychrophila]|uniref:C2H2-type domain-containing protein n=1 Tax=Athelia psychrophila TaxID=1759441 RepID=A0A166KC07_9AGAM|nr:hypothetical protein FIBSPDRAFT_919510 [Fibularhizoctonia sp. CBS 109695]